MITAIVVTKGCSVVLVPGRQLPEQRASPLLAVLPMWRINILPNPPLQECLVHREHLRWLELLSSLVFLIKF